MDLIKKSAKTASAKLQFCRLAFGAAGSAGAQIDTGDAEKVARGLMEDEKTKIAWNLPRVLLAKNRVKLLLNMLLLAAQAIPRGGQLIVDPVGEGDAIGLPGHGRPAPTPRCRRRSRRCSAARPAEHRDRCPCDPAVLHRHARQELRADRRRWRSRATRWWSPRGNAAPRLTAVNASR